MRKQTEQSANESIDSLGAVPRAEGTRFRVWAPQADSVFVLGTFNDWQLLNPLAPDRKGYWSGFVQGAQPGHEYKYVIENDGVLFARTDPYAREIAGDRKNGVICKRFESEQNSKRPFSVANRDRLIIYEIHVGSFGETEESPPAKFQDVIDKLPYLHDLGVNAIELMPVMEFSGQYSWGYNPGFPFAVSRVYGGRAGLKNLVDSAHTHGIGVIVDVVYNHFGPEELVLWQYDGWAEDQRGGIYFYNDWRRITPWAETRPDYERAEVRRFIRDNVIMWLDEYGVDGLRFDATAYIRNVYGRDEITEGELDEGWSLLQWLNEEVHERYPDAVTIAEDLQNNSQMVDEVSRGGAGFDSQWDGNFAYILRKAITAAPADDDNISMEAVRNAVTRSYGDSVFNRVIYTESHDEVGNEKTRIVGELIDKDVAPPVAKKRAFLALGMTLIAPGIPMLFQGQEFLESASFQDSKALNWNRARANHDLIKLIRRLIRLRLNRDATTRGLTGENVRVYHMSRSKKLLGIYRWDTGGPGDDVVIVTNFSATPYDEYRIGFPRPGIWKVRCDSDDIEYGRINDSDDSSIDRLVAAVRGRRDGLPCQGTVSIGSYSLLILSQD